MSKIQLRAGVIGCGMIAQTNHMPALSKLDNVEITAFCDISKDRALKAKNQYGNSCSKVYEDYRGLLMDKNVDLVYICTTNKWHSQMTIEALESGKHVMCEKPMAINAIEGKKMVEAKNRMGKKLSIAYRNRFKADALYVHSLCKEGVLGYIYYAKAHALRRRGVPTRGAFLSKDEQGGGALLDVGSHAIDMTLWMMNNYEVKCVMGNTYQELAKKKNMVNSNGSWTPDEFEVEDSAFAMLTMQDRSTIIIESSWAINMVDPLYARCTLCGTEAGIEMIDGVRINGEKYGRLYTTMVDLNTGVAPYMKDNETRGELQTRLWIENILNDTEPIVTAEQAIVVDEIIDAIYKSSKTGKPVFLEEDEK